MQEQRGPRGASTMSASMRHGALLVAVTGTLLVGAQFARPTHADAQADARLDDRVARIASIDGRMPDGAPSALPAATMVQATAEARTLVAVTALDPPMGTATVARATSPAAAPEPAPMVAALAAIAQASKDPLVPALTRITATPAPTPEPVVRAAVVAPAPSRYAGIGELNVALAQTAWPAELWPTVVSIALCEAGVDRDRDGRYDAVDTQASGAGGRYIGALQIGASHRFSQPHDLWSLVGNLNAGYELWVGAGHSFAPWGCH